MSVCRVSDFGPLHRQQAHDLFQVPEDGPMVDMWAGNVCKANFCQTGTKPGAMGVRVPNTNATASMPSRGRYDKYLEVVLDNKPVKVRTFQTPMGDVHLGETSTKSKNNGYYSPSQTDINTAVLFNPKILSKQRYYT